jgi:PAS domain S-box-containing protein
MDRLLNSREQLLILLNTLADGVTAEDKTGKLIYANQAAAQTLVYESPDNLLGTSIADVLQKFEITDESGQVIELDRFPVQLALQGIHSPDTTFRFRERGTGRDHWLVLKSRPAFNESGDVHFVVNVLQDVTEIKQSAQALQENQHRLQAIFDNTDDAILLTNNDAQFIDANRAAVALTGYSYDELLQLHVWDITPELGLKEGKDLWQLFSNSERQEGEYVVRRKDGTTVDVEYRAVANIVPGMHLSVLHDVSERKQIERQRQILFEQERTARLKAEQADELKLKFLAMISHELRTPLTSIKGFASTLLADDVTWDADSQQDFLAIIDQEANKLTDLVEQLLDVSRLHAQTLRITPTTQPLNQAFDTAMPQLQQITTHHQLQMNIPGTLPLVSFDAHRIAQVVVNLVDNATKYSPRGSRITLTVTQQNSSVKVTVADEGVGIPVDERDMVFEAFRQVERHNKGQKGAGLGLAICKGLVEAHGGQIWVEDQPPPGTTISFTLPVVADEGR